jgi:general secretion pathway protein N
MMGRLIIWILAGVISIALIVLAFFPAAWIVPLVEKQTGGRITLGDAQGTLWNGSAFLGGAASGRDAMVALLPGRFTWQLSPLVLLGSVNAELENPEALTQPVTVTGSWNQWQVSPAAILLPAERLAALGAPLNTVQPSGQMRLSWGLLQVARQEAALGITGTMNLEMNDIASRMSPVKPLGSYNLALDWRGTEASAALKTVKGPLLLSGAGTLVNGRFQFSGKAEAETGQQEKLANFLNLLGQRRREGDKDIIALEFR